MGIGDFFSGIGKGIGHFFGGTYGDPDKVNVNVDKADYSGAEWNPYSSWLDTSKAYQFDPTQADQSRGYALQGLQGYQDTISGGAPSVAQQQLQQGLAQSQGQALALAASARGGPGQALLAQQQAQRTGAGLALAGGAQAAALRAQEVAQAQQGYGQMALALHGADQQQQQMQQQNYAQFQALQGQGRAALASGRAAVASQYAGDKLAAQTSTVQQNAAAEAAAANRRAGFINQIGQMAGAAAKGGTSGGA